MAAARSVSGAAKDSAIDTSAGAAIDPAIDALVRRRSGVLRITEIDGHGGSGRRQPVRPDWQRLLPGVVLASARPPTRRDRRLAALRYAGAGAVLTGLTALRLHGFRKVPVEWEVVLLVPRRRRRISSSYVRIERTGRLPPHGWRDGLPCAPVARALVDAVRRMRDPIAVTALYDQAIDRRLCSVTELAAELSAADGRGLRTARQRFAELRERLLEQADRALAQLVEQAGLSDDSGVAVHLDASDWRLSTAATVRDRAALRRLTKTGVPVVRITPERLIAHPAEVLTELLAARSRSRPNRTDDERR